MINKHCTNCVNFKVAERKPNGYINHKNSKGEVWMREPIFTTIPSHCPINQKAYEEWSEKIKDMIPRDTETVLCDCESFEAHESHKAIDNLLNLTSELLDKLKKD